VWYSLGCMTGSEVQPCFLHTQRVKHTCDRSPRLPCSPAAFEDRINFQPQLQRNSGIEGLPLNHVEMEMELAVADGHCHFRLMVQKQGGKHRFLNSSLLYFTLSYILLAVITRPNISPVNLTRQTVPLWRWDLKTTNTSRGHTNI